MAIKDNWKPKKKTGATKINLPSVAEKEMEKGKHIWTQRTETRVVTDALSRASQDPDMIGRGLNGLVSVLLLNYGQGRKG